MKVSFPLALAVLFLISACGTAPVVADEPATFTSSDSVLTARFNWAAQTALSYARQGDPVGDWYEAALPGRDAFCMRDVAHQAVGAHVLGLSRHTKNMLGRFASAQSESKDWCSYWEIDREDRPAPVDYASDDAFWYNLPANFDLVDAIWRMYRWTGDRDYVSASAFRSFTDRSLEEYVDRWALAPEAIFGRPRFMNRPSFDPENYYEFARGIPSYHEGQLGQTQLGVDLLAFAAQGFEAGAGLSEALGLVDSASARRERAAEYRDLIDRNFWDESAASYQTILRPDGIYETGGGLMVYLLYTSAVADSARRGSTLQAVMEAPVPGIEIASHFPEVYYRMGAAEAGYAEVLALSDEGRARRAYPEVSFALVGAVASGLMGIQPGKGDASLRTLPQLPGADGWAELSGIWVGGARTDIRHEGNGRSILMNRSSRPVRWTAAFRGSFELLAVDGVGMDAGQATDDGGHPVSFVEVTVPAGEVRVVATPGG